MRKLSNRLAVAAVAAIAAATVATDTLAAPAQRTFVRSDGADANTCSIAQPCRSFAAALGKTAAEGEIIVLDSAGYGAVIINQSVAIIAPSGIYAGISVFSDDGIAINGDATVNVVLRGLTINGLGGNVGIHLQQGARLHVEGCEVSNMAGDGISIEADGAEVFVNDSIARDNGGNGIGLIAAATVVIDRLRSERNGNGVGASQGSLTVRDSAVSRNGFRGISMDTAVAGSTLVVEGTMIVGNGGDGVFAGRSGLTVGDADLVVARNTIIDNDRGVYIAGSVSGGVLAAVTDNVIKGSKGIGLLVTGMSVMTAAGNTVTRSGAAGLAAQTSGTLRTRSNNTAMDNTPDLDPGTTLTPLSAL